MAIIDSVVRLLPGAIRQGATETESFSEENTLEHPHYTRPEVFEGKKVPVILLSGDHKKIEEWKSANSPKTQKKA